MSPFPTTLRASFALLAASLLSAPPAFAGYIGHEVSAQYLFPTVDRPWLDSGTAVAGAGVEFANFNQFGHSIDFSDTTIRVTYELGWVLAGGADFDGWVFNGATPENIIGVTLGATDIAGLTAASLSFNDHQVFLNTAGLVGWPAGSFVSIDVLFAEPGAAVPAPGSLALAGLGLMTMVVCRPRRQYRPPRFGPSLGTA